MVRIQSPKEEGEGSWKTGGIWQHWVTMATTGWRGGAATLSVGACAPSSLQPPPLPFVPLTPLAPIMLHQSLHSSVSPPGPGVTCVHSTCLRRGVLQPGSNGGRLAGDSAGFADSPQTSCQDTVLPSSWSVPVSPAESLCFHILGSSRKPLDIQVGLFPECVHGCRSWSWEPVSP